MPGKQMQPVQKLGQAIQQKLVGQQGVWLTKVEPGTSLPNASEPSRGSFPQTWANHGYIFRVPSAVASKQLCLVSPLSFCKKLKVEPEVLLGSGPGESSGPNQSSSSAGRFGYLEEYYARGSGWGDPRSERSPLQEILFAQMAYVMQNFDSAESILTTCSRILDPDGSRLQGRICAVPKRETLRRSLIKLDLCLMLNRRVFHSPSNPQFLIHRFLSSDASPQAHSNFFCTIEDIVKQPVSFKLLDGADVFTAGFEVERRSLPALTLGKGEASTAHKARLLLHCGCLENGQANLLLWRRQVASFLSDQGTERNLPQFPVNIEGDLGEFISHFSMTLCFSLELFLYLEFCTSCLMPLRKQSCRLTSGRSWKNSCRLFVTLFLNLLPKAWFWKNCTRVLRGKSEPWLKPSARNC